MNRKHPLFQEELRGIAALDAGYEHLDGKTVAVTGASGLVGVYLMYALDAIRQKHSLKLRLLALGRNRDRTLSRLEGIEGLEFVPYDACRPIDAEFTADSLVHAASNAHPLAFSSDPVGTMQANLLGTMNLLEHCKARGGRFLMISTGEVYGENPALEDGFDEHSFGAIDPMRFRACYPESKRAAETLAASYAHQYGVDALVARLTYVYGASITDENSRADAQFLRRALKHEDIVLKSEGAQLRSYLYAADAASALIMLLLKGEAGLAYNVASPNCAVSIRSYAETLAELAGVKLLFDLPPEAERAGYSAVTRAVLKSDRLMALGWRPAYDLKTGLAHTLEISK